MKTVASFRNLSEAHMLQSQLEGSGIESFLKDENTVQIDWLLSNAVGGVKVEVDEKDFETANEIYQQYRGQSENEARTENKKRHGFARYLKLASIVFGGVLAFLLFKRPPSELFDVGFHLVIAGFVGVAVGLFFALLDL